jgi:hypothetical protein
MNSTTLLCATTILGATVASATTAQSATTTPRAIYASQEGGAAGYMFGNWATARYEFADGNHTAKAFAIKEIAYRHDYRMNFNGVANGRSWSNVKLSMSRCDYAKVDKVYYNNPTSAPTLVFNKAVVWPTQANIPTKRPQPWIMRFPFATAWAKKANTDILLDYVFTGGRLANNRAWGKLNIGYWLDSFTARQFSCAARVTYGKSATQGGCPDGGNTSTWGASTSLRVCTYPPTYPNTSLRNKVVIAGGGSSYGKSSTVATLLGFRGLPTGVAFPGVTCNRIHIDTTLPTLLSVQKTSAFSTNLAPITFGLPGGVATYRPAYAGAELIAQSAWSDTKSGAMRISSAAASYVPLAPMFASAATVRLKSIWTTTPVVRAGVFGLGYNVTTPIWRYSH